MSMDKLEAHLCLHYMPGSGQTQTTQWPPQTLFFARRMKFDLLLAGESIV